MGRADVENMSRPGVHGNDDTLSTRLGRGQTIGAAQRPRRPEIVEATCLEATKHHVEPRAPDDHATVRQPVGRNGGGREQREDEEAA